jgi:hypothetical protein
MKTLNKFIQLAVQEKGVGDYRAFLYYEDEFGEEQEIRGYGPMPMIAAHQVWERYEDLK